MKPYVYLILFVLILALPFLLRGALTSAPTQHAQLRLVVVTPHNQDIRREFGYAFSDWHQKKYGQAVEIDYRTPGGTNDIKRLLENHAKLTDSPVAKAILADWENELRWFVKVMPTDYRNALAKMGEIEEAANRLGKLQTVAK